MGSSSAAPRRPRRSWSWRPNSMTAGWRRAGRSAIPRPHCSAPPPWPRRFRAARCWPSKSAAIGRRRPSSCSALAQLNAMEGRFEQGPTVRRGRARPGGARSEHQHLDRLRVITGRDAGRRPRQGRGAPAVTTTSSSERLASATSARASLHSLHKRYGRRERSTRPTRSPGSQRSCPTPTTSGVRSRGARSGPSYSPARVGPRKRSRPPGTPSSWRPAPRISSSTPMRSSTSTRCSGRPAGLMNKARRSARPCRSTNEKATWSSRDGRERSWSRGSLSG